MSHRTGRRPPRGLLVGIGILATGALLAAGRSQLPAVGQTASVSALPTVVAAASNATANKVDATPVLMWERPPGPLRVAIQAGHWKAAEAPDEQAGLRTNGTRAAGKAEWEVNLEIARRAAAMLEERGFIVEVLPTTIPPGYWADLFVAIHADGNPNTSTSGFRAAAPRRDVTGKAHEFVEVLERTYGEATGLRKYPTVTRRMTGYYAFNWRRYRHALHPMTVGVILETGFLTSPHDRRIIVENPDRAARGVAEAIATFGERLLLDSKPVPMPTPVRAPRPLRTLD